MKIRRPKDSIKVNSFSIDNISQIYEKMYTNSTHQKNKQMFVKSEKEIESVDNEFVFIKDTTDFIIQMKQIINRHLNSRNEFKVIAAYNLDFFLIRHNCFTTMDLEKINWREMFDEYQASKELQNSARMIGLECLFIRFEAHFKERYNAFECKIKSGDSENCILCIQNWYII